MEMKKSARAVAAALLMGFAAMGAAQAQGAYGGVSYTQYNFEGSGAVGAIKPTATTLSLGYAFSKYIALEGRLAVPMTEDGHTVFGTKVTGKVEHHYGLYAKGMLPVGDTVTLYGLLGANDLSLKVSGGGYSSSSAQSSSSLGAGVDVAITKSLSVNAEWMRNFSDVTSVNLGLGFKF